MTAERQTDNLIYSERASLEIDSHLIGPEIPHF